MTIDSDFTGQTGCFSFFTWFRQHFTTILIISMRNTLLQAPHGLLLPPFPFFLAHSFKPTVLELLGRILYILGRIGSLRFPFLFDFNRFGAFYLSRLGFGLGCDMVFLPLGFLSFFLGTRVRHLFCYLLSRSFLLALSVLHFVVECLMLVVFVWVYYYYPYFSG